MKKVTLFLALVALLIVALNGLVAAAPVPSPAHGNGYCHSYGQTYDNLNDEQKAQIAAWDQQGLEQRKQMLQKQVEWGYLTQEQADRQVSWMEQQMANGDHDWGSKGMMGRHGGKSCW